MIAYLGLSHIYCTIIYFLVSSEWASCFHILKGYSVHVNFIGKLIYCLSEKKKSNLPFMYTRILMDFYVSCVPVGVKDLALRMC